MAASEPIDPRVRLAISQWPDDAPRGAVSTFCAEHGISRKSFYELRKRALVDGPAAVLEPRTRRPRTSPSKLSDDVKEQAVGGARRAGGLRAGPWAGQRARQDARDGPGPGALGRVASADLPRGRRRPAGAAQEAEGGVAAVRLSGPERLLAARRHRICTHPRAQVCDLPAHRRPLPLRSRLPRRLGRDLRGRDRRVRQGRGRSRRAPTAAVRQRVRAQPVTARTPGPARRSRDGPGRRADHRQALQTDHPGQERTLPPNPVPLPRQATTGRRPGPAANPG